MRGAHVAGGGAGAILGAVLAAVLRKYVGWNVTDIDASLIGSAALSVGVAFGHLVSSVGIVPAVRRALYGPDKPPRVVLVEPPPKE